MLNFDTRKQFYNSKIWKDKKKEIYLRDRGQCQSCGCNITKTVFRKKNGQWTTLYGNVDHINPIDDINFNNEELALNNDNLQLLCLSCHGDKTRGKENYIKNNEFDFDKRDKDNFVFDLDFLK